MLGTYNVAVTYTNIFVMRAEPDSSGENLDPAYLGDHIPDNFKLLRPDMTC